MAVTFDAQSSGSVNPATTLTVAHTCSGSDRVLLVGLSTNNTTDIVTSVTYNGVAMTRLQAQVGSSGNFYSYLYYLQNPASGTNNIVATASSSSLMGAISSSFTGAAQVSTPDASAAGTATGAGTTISATLTVSATDSMLFGHCRGSNNLNVDTGTTSNGTLFTSAFISGYSSSLRATGSQTLAFTRTSADPTLWLVASIAPVETKYADYLIVAGGGSGGSGAGGGGGAGAHRKLTSQVITSGTYTVTVGAGASAANGADVRGNNGSDSSFNSTTSTGGGGGGSYGGTNATGKNGGSGGGGGWGSGSTPTGGTGTTGGNNGGSGVTSDSSAGGGGGGAGAVGSNGSGTTGGNGGNGTADSITGSSVTRAGGGGSSGWTTHGTGGTGGGGNGAASSAGAGTANTGGGGGGARDAFTSSGAGGSGVVIVRLLTSDWSSITGGTQTTDGSYTVCTFNSSGSLVLASGGATVNSSFFMFM